MFILKTKIPCENCANSIKATLKQIQGISSISCSVTKSEIIIETIEGKDEEIIRDMVVLELKKTGRICEI